MMRWEAETGEFLEACGMANLVHTEQQDTLYQAKWKVKTESPEESMWLTHSSVTRAGSLHMRAQTHAPTRTHTTTTTAKINNEGETS